MENTVDKQKTNDAGEEKICPYMKIPCTADCPAWLDDLDDCLFHVCMTEVRETFVAAARFVDEKLGLKPGSGLETLSGIRDLVKAPDGEVKTQVIGAVLGQMMKQQAANFVGNLSEEDITRAITRAEEVIDFGFEAIFGADPEEPDEN